MAYGDDYGGSYGGYDSWQQKWGGVAVIVIIGAVIAWATGGNTSA